MMNGDNEEQLSRAAFLSALISALKENSDDINDLATSIDMGNDTNITTQSFFRPQRTSGDILELAKSCYNSLQFDFPIVQEDEAIALARYYQFIAQSRQLSDESIDFQGLNLTMTTELATGIAYLTSKNSTEPYGILAASVYLLFVKAYLINPAIIPNAVISNAGTEESQHIIQVLHDNTASNLFSHLCPDSWEKYQLTQAIISIIEWIYLPKRSDNLNECINITRGQQYFAVLRDRILQYPTKCQDILSIIEGFLANLTLANIDAMNSTYTMIYELVTASEFKKSSERASRQTDYMLAQRTLVTALNRFVPTMQTHMESIALEMQKAKEMGNIGNLRHIWLTIYQFLLSTSIQTTPSSPLFVRNIYTSGSLRSFINIWSTLQDESSMEDLQNLTTFLSILALWSRDVAIYIIRVPAVINIIHKVVQESQVSGFVLAFALEQHNLQQNVKLKLVPWVSILSTDLFPENCDSFSNAINALKTTIFILEQITLYQHQLQPKVQNILQRSLRTIYTTSFSQNVFQYPHPTPDTSSPNKDSQEPLLNQTDAAQEDKGQAEATQYLRLKNTLRQLLKQLLATSSKCD